MSDPQPGGGGPRSSPFQFLSLGFEVAVPVVLLMIAGYMLDGWIGTQPWFLLVGALLGIAVGIYSLFKRVLPPKGSGPES